MKRRNRWLTAAVFALIMTFAFAGQCYGADAKIINMDDNALEGEWSIQSVECDDNNIDSNTVINLGAGARYAADNGSLMYTTEAKLFCEECRNFSTTLDVHCYDAAGKELESGKCHNSTRERYESYNQVHSICSGDVAVPVGTVKITINYHGKTGGVDNGLFVAGAFNLIEGDEQKSLYAKGNWMTDLDDNTRLAQMNIPGSHDSGTYYIATLQQGPGQAQDLTIPEQLQIGGRAFDIRYKFKAAAELSRDKDEDFYIYHGKISDFGQITECVCYRDKERHYQLRLTKVLDYFTEFLEKNPGETILASIGLEEKGYSNDPELKKILERYGVIVLDEKNADTITLGECRGKIVEASVAMADAPGDRNRWSASRYEKVDQMHKVFGNESKSVYDPTLGLESTNTSCQSASIRATSRYVKSHISDFCFQNGISYGIVNYDYLDSEDIQNLINANSWARKTVKDKNIYWGIRDGTLFLRNNEIHNADQEGSFPRNSVFSQKDPAPWYQYRDSIKRVYSFKCQAPESTSYWFYGLDSINQSINLVNMDMSDVTDMSNMFSNCGASVIRFGDTDVSGVVNMSGMFSGCSNLTDVDSMEWDVTSVTDFSEIFSGCSSIVNIHTEKWNIKKAKDISGAFRDCTSMVSSGAENWNVINVRKMNGAFSGCESLTRLNLKGWNTTNVSDLSGMFRDCSRLTSTGTEAWILNNVTSTVCMFEGCTSLPNVPAAGWDVSEVTDMSGMFSECSSIKAADLSGWDTSSVQNMSGMFDGCTGLAEAVLSSWDTSGVESAAGMFKNCTQLENVQLDKWSTVNTTDMSSMFCGCEALQEIDLTDFNTFNMRYAEEMFSGCESLTTIYASNLWTGNMLDSSEEMFAECTSLVGGNGTAFDPAHTDGEYAVAVEPGSTVPGYLTMKDKRDLSHVFWGLKERTLYISNEEIPGAVVKGEFFTEEKFTEDKPAPWYMHQDRIKSVVTSGIVRPKYTEYWFADMKEVTSMDLNLLDTAEVISMSNMFNRCRSLTELICAAWKTSGVKNMSGMFFDCESLTSLDLSRWDTSSANSMADMFSGCSSLKTARTEKFKTDSVKSMRDMFQGCQSLTAADISGWNTSSVEDMSGMFRECSSMAELATGNWNTSAVSKMSGMFSGCSSLKKLNLKSIDTSYVSDMSDMFAYCSELKTIYAEAPLYKLSAKSDGMFRKCSSLIGQNGTTYNAEHTDGSYAVFDNEGSPGYLWDENAGKNESDKKMIPGKATVKSVKVGKHRIKVTVKPSKYSEGYQIAYRPAGSKAKYRTVSTSKKTVTIKKLKSGKKYSIKVRGYKKSSGKTVYGSWSKVKKSARVK